MSTSSQLSTKLQQAVNDVLLADVYKVVVNAEKQTIESDVYDSYTPKSYNRRREDGGLIAESNFDGSIVEDGVLKVSNITQANPDITTGTSKNAGKALVPMLVEGGDSNYDFGEPAPPSHRNFVKDTVDNLQNSDEIRKALIKGLRAKGFRIK